MSAEAQTFVEQWSPYEGSTYAVHLRLALLANDANNYDIWCGDKYLADKCRCSLASVKRAKATLIKDGYLERVSPAFGRRVAHFRFVFKGVRIAGQGDPPPARIAGRPVSNSGSSASASPINELNEKKNDEVSKITDIEVGRQLMADVRKRLGGMSESG